MKLSKLFSSLALGTALTLAANTSAQARQPGAPSGGSSLTRTDVSFFRLPESAHMQVSREFLEVRPLDWEWGARVSGLEYNVRFRENPEVATDRKWRLGAGFKTGYYQSLDAPESGNVRTRAYLEVFRPGHAGRLPVTTVFGTAFQQVSGPDVGHDVTQSLYTTFIFPRLFEKRQASVDGTDRGRFSGLIRVSAETDGDVNGRAGLYYHHRGARHSGRSFTIGPEVRYDDDSGASVRVNFTPGGRIRF